MRRPAWRRRQRGQSATEFVVIFPALVLLVFGILQMGFVYQGRSTLNYATMLAARAGALHNGDVGEMRNALARGLAPLFAGEATTAGYSAALAKAAAETAGPAALTSIEILNPRATAFTDFGRTRLDGTKGKELPNDTLAYRNSGAGAASKQSVQDANLLHVRVTYCFRLIVPVIDRVVQAAFNGNDPGPGGMGDPFGLGGASAPTLCNAATAGRRIYIQSEAIVRMQSPFFESNLAGANTPGTPGPSTPGDPGAPSEPGTPADPGDPIPQPDPGDPPCF
nr:TadE/TadG family type IV pilus assembly protein [uncultured Duganella sp.]